MCRALKCANLHIYTYSRLHFEIHGNGIYVVEVYGIGNERSR